MTAQARDRLLTAATWVGMVLWVLIAAWIVLLMIANVRLGA